MAAFQRALAIGVTTIETDLAVTKDGVLVLAHDPSLNPDLARGPGGAWLSAKGPPINTLTLAELTRYDVGRINPASAYAKQFPEQQPADGQQIPDARGPVRAGRRASPSASTSRPSSRRRTPPRRPTPRRSRGWRSASIRNAGVTERVTVQSFDWRTLAEVKKIAPEIATSCLTIETANNDTVQRGAAAGSPWHAGLGWPTTDSRCRGSSRQPAAAPGRCSGAT